MRARLTDDLIRSTRPPARGQALIWDDLTDGFGARFTPNACAFVVQYRDGKKRIRKTFAEPAARGGATHGWAKLTAADARKQAQAILLKHTGAASGAETLATVMMQWAEMKQGRPRYVTKVKQITEVWVAGEPLSRGKKTPAEAHAIAEMGSQSPANVTRAHVLKLLDAMTAAGRKGVAEQVLAIISSFFNWAIEREMAVANPARNRLRLLGGRSVRKRKLNDPELVALWKAFEPEAYPAFDAFRLLVLTGARRREVTQARWSEFNLEKRLWVIPEDRVKTGVEHTIALAPPVVAMLRKAPRVAGNDHVFVGQRDGQPFDFHYALMTRIKERTPDLAHWVLHDLRRSMRSGLASLGVSQVVAELCLNHQSAKGGLVGVYDVHSYEEEMATAWKRWCAHVERLVRKAS